MKRIIIIAGYVYPDTSPTGKIAMQFADILKENYEVSMLYIQSGLERVEGVKHNGITLHAIYNVRLYWEQYLIQKTKTSSTVGIQKLFKIATKVVKGIGRINAWFVFPRSKCYALWPTNLIWFYPKAYRKLVKLHNKKNFDVVFSVTSPFPAHLAARKFKLKYPYVRWVTYTVDPYARASGFTKTFILPNLKAKVDIKVEKSIYELADYNFVSEEVFNTEAELYLKELYKTVALPYLLLPNSIKSEKKLFPSDKINLVYAGTFYESIRNPEYLFKTFLAVDNPNILLHLYIVGDCDSLIDSYVNRSKGRIIRHESVSIEKVPCILSQADILISVGNSTTSFKPSKIFEYIATGKPIVHFYQNGLCDEILLKYNASFQIDQSIPIDEKRALEFVQYCLNNRSNKLEWKDIIIRFQNHSLDNIRNLLLNGFCNNAE